MRGQVLEVSCQRPDLAVKVLRRSGQFQEVALYGAQFHVVAEDATACKPAIKKILAGQGLEVRSMALISPSLEDVFIASARENMDSYPGGLP